MCSYYVGSASKNDIKCSTSNAGFHASSLSLRTWNGPIRSRFRLAAQREAQKVATVAPVWVMPEYRIAEQLPPDIEAFDLHILDEASQSDITAIAALARGKQVLIVGDEEQQVQQTGDTKTD